MKRLAVLGSMLALATAVGTAWSSADTRVIYLRLLDRPFPAKGLPAGYSSVKVSGTLDTDLGTPGGDHKIGTVLVTLSGPDGRDEIFYDIFSSVKAARHGLTHPSRNLHRVGRIRGYREPGALFAVRSVRGYLAVVVQGKVAIAGVADASGTAHAKNSALKLLAAGYKHLRAVETR